MVPITFQFMALSLFSFHPFIESFIIVHEVSNSHWNISGRHQEDTTSSSSQSTTTVVTTPGYTIDYADHSLKCRNIATDYVYSNNLCNAKDPESYLMLNKAYYSCEGRCGITLSYSSMGRKECACDAACIIHKDCCRDIHIVCPKVYADAFAKFPFYDQYNSFCEYTNSMIVFYCGSGTPREEESYDEIDTLYLHHPLLYFEENNLLPLLPRTLKQYIYGLGYLAVVDISTGLIFRNVDELHFCNQPSPKLYFLPVIVFLKCSKNTPTKDRINVDKFLGWCKSVKVFEVESPFHRNCVGDEFIGCPCGKGFHMTEHLHNACVGFNVSLPRLYRRQLFNYQENGVFSMIDNVECSKFSNMFSQLPSDNDMQISISTIPKDYAMKFPTQPDAGNNSGSNATSPKIKFHAGENYLASSLKHIENGGRESKNSRSEEEAKKNRTNNSLLDTSLADVVPDEWLQLQNGRFIKHEDLLHVVEISNTIERRLLCHSLNGYVSDCQILDCDRGAILSHDAATGDHFGGTSCLRPSVVVVKTKSLDRPVPLCWCMRVLVFFSDFDIWDINMDASESQKCVLKLAYEDAVHNEPLEAYELGKTTRLPDPRTKWTLSLKDFTERVRNLYRNTSLFCNGTSSSVDIDLDVCFQLPHSETHTSDFSCTSIRDGDVVVENSRNCNFLLSSCVGLLSAMFVVRTILL